jgi:16S rRNA (cytidine1402-2'-O)-methyltransferase
VTQPEPATIYLVATPIGNLADISLRALETLQQVDVIAAEDTRKTGRLLKHHGIKKPLISFYEHNQERALEQIVGLVRAGQSVACVTTAGTPGIADPGFVVVRRAIEQDLPLTMIPGPTALVMALVLSGLPTHSFTFRGFTPRKAAARRRYYQADRESPYTLVYYESPHRLAASLADAREVFGDRPAALANDLTKLYEAVARGTLSELLASIEAEGARGEYVLVIAGRDAAED